MRERPLACALAALLAAPAAAQEPAQEPAQADPTTAELLAGLEALERRLAAYEGAAPADPDAAAEEGAPTDADPDPTVFNGGLEPNQRGFHLAHGEFGSLDFSLYAYLRYLNQTALDDTHTTEFGQTIAVDQRQDIQFQKAILYFKGWFLDERFRYITYAWSANTSQGLGAQVVVAGYLSYVFDPSFALSGGIGGLPTTRSMEGEWPRMLKVDSRTIADEFFRGSYTTGVWANGRLGETLQYKAMLGNNLSQLGVDAGQLDDTLDTFSTALVWMPTTGEFGPVGGFGDFDDHEDVATRFGLHYTHSTEDAQSQPGVNDPENTQIRLSDGTNLFDTAAFGAGNQVDSARYQMVSVDGGVKHAGLALEGEYYLRWIGDLDVTGTVPFTSLFDHGFQVQLSHMAVPRTLQVYTGYSLIFGEYGDPWDLSVGANWFPGLGAETFDRQLRLNGEVIFLHESPTGNFTVPYTVGADGPVFSLTLELYF